MPPQETATPQVSDSSIDAFMGLDEGGQRAALGKMSDPAKQALLTGIKSRKSAPAATPPQTNLTPPPSANPEQEGTLKKLGRGAAMGATEGAGFGQTESAADNLGTLASNVVGGAAKIVSSPLEATKGMAEGFAGAGGEAWEGLKTGDPEKFAHGFGSALAQAFLAKSAFKEVGKLPSRTAPGEAAMNKVVAGAKITGDALPSFKQAWPEILKTSKGLGISTIGDFVQSVTTAKQAIDAKFNNAFASIRNQQYLPIEISNRINNLITSDLQQTAAGRAEIRQIRRAAKEYNKPWTLDQLNAKRMTENDNLASFYNKDTQGQAAARVEQHISKAVRDGAADIVYNQLDQANPGMKAQEMKRAQGALWDTEIHVKAALNDLEAKQRTHQAQGPFARLKTGISASGKGVPHGYVSGIADMFSGGPMAEANDYVRSGLNPTLSERASRIGKPAFWYLLKNTATAALPLSALTGRASDANKPLRPPPSSDDE